jgi:hypothetical protein
MTNHHPVAIKLDPNKAFAEADKLYLQDCCGLLLPWTLSAFFEDGGVDTAEDVKDFVAKQYMFPTFPLKGGAIDEEDVYQYPDDPPLNPVAKISSESGIDVLIYQYAIIAFRDEAMTYITRMD